MLQGLQPPASITDGNMLSAICLQEENRQIEGWGLQFGRTAQDDSLEDALLQVQDEAGGGGFTSYLSQHIFIIHFFILEQVVQIDCG